jgi:hypothetical protein
MVNQMELSFFAVINSSSIDMLRYYIDAQRRHREKNISKSETDYIHLFFPLSLRNGRQHLGYCEVAL